MRIGQRYLLKRNNNYYATVISFTVTTVEYFCSACQENETSTITGFFLAWEIEKEDEEIL
jgi:hypothetical protein